MASPVAHSLTGYLIYRLTVRPGDTDRWPPLWAYIVIANFPDIDIVFGLLHNTPFQYHRASIANSLGITLGFALLAWCCACIFSKGIPVAPQLAVCRPLWGPRAAGFFWRRARSAASMAIGYSGL